MGKKLADHLEDHTLANKNAPLLQQFKNISTLVHQQLNHIIDERAAAQLEDSEDDESINIKDLQNDFATDDFISKNVRVRPTSSHSGGKGGRDESEAAHKFGGPSSVGDDGDDDRKFNADQLIELNFIRNEQKERKRNDEERKLREADLAEKKKKQKQ